jgi:hypothetical protein
MLDCLCRLRDSPSCLMMGFRLSSVLRLRLLLGCVAGCTTRMGTWLVKRPPAYVPTLGLNATRPYMPPARCKLVTAVLLRRMDMKWERATRKIAHVPGMIFQCRDTEIVVTCLHSQCGTHAFAGTFGFGPSVGIWSCQFLNMTIEVSERSTTKQHVKYAPPRIFDTRWSMLWRMFQK